MSKEDCRDYAKYYMKKGGKWKVLAAICFIAFVFMTVAALSLKMKNKKYCETIVELSDNFPITEEQEEELAEIRKREWGRANALRNRKSDEERIAENRITEEA